MKKKDRIFHETYKIDESTHLYMIEIALNQYADIFNQWDSAPLERREVAPSLESYLESCSDDIPFQYSIEFYIILPQGIRDKQLEEKSQRGIENHFTFKVYQSKKELNQNNCHSLYFLLTGFFLLGLESIVNVEPSQVLPYTLEQGLLIGGWVFIWEAVSRFFFKNRELYYRYQTYQRLRDAPIIFREVETNLV